MARTTGNLEVISARESYEMEVWLSSNTGQILAFASKTFVIFVTCYNLPQFRFQLKGNYRRSVGPRVLSSTFELSISGQINREIHYLSTALLR